MPGQLPDRITVWTPARRERPTPTPAADEVVVAVEAAALAGPELRAFAQRGAFAPGEAAVGRVVHAGDAAADLIGRRVLVGPVEACGECDVCRRGHPALCPTRRRAGIDRDGALASHVVARGRWLTPLDGALAAVAPGPEAAALAREAPLAYTMFARAGIAPGETTVWLGDGVVARFGAQIARSRGAHAITLTDAELGLAPHEIAAALRARLADEPGAIPWRVFETTGRDDSRRRAFGLAVWGATLVLAAGDAVGTDDDAPLALAAALDHDVTIAAVAAPHPDLVTETAALTVRGDLDLADSCVVVPAAELERALDDLRADRLPRKLLVITGL